MELLKKFLKSHFELKLFIVTIIFFAFLIFFTTVYPFARLNVARSGIHELAG